MYKVIDTATNVGEFAGDIRRAGVETVIRYFNNSNSSNLPNKRLEPTEAQQLYDAGLSVMTVFQQRGGADGNIGDLTAAKGDRDANRALDLADAIKQPDGSAIYFAVDYDYYRQSELVQIEPYFATVRSVLGNRFRVGVYGSGRVGSYMVDRGHADLIWLAAARGWSGTRDLLTTDRWALYQIFPAETWENGAFTYDGNTVNPNWRDFGQFRPASDSDGSGPDIGSLTGAATIMEVTARSGLNLRRGPSSSYAVEKTLPLGAQVYAVRFADEWVQVDIQGDGIADGFMHGDYLRVLSGGLPLPVDGEETPYDIARAELALDVREVPGPGNNPRIVLYHSSVMDGGSTDDSVPWCSSFMNYCVAQAGYEGTNSKWALTWDNWGEDVTDAPREGDIAVFSRKGRNENGGHVGFVVDVSATHIQLLGGNQSDRVKITRYPKDGKLGSLSYKLKSIRRA